LQSLFRNYDRHLARLGQIKQKKRKVDLHEQDKLTQQANENKFFSRGFNYQERDMIIKKDNQILLDKLVEISHGKWVRLYF
jgi:hypothetical protein